jgi:hypothetical protein
MSDVVIGGILGILFFEGKRISREDVFFDDLAFDEVFLDDALQNFGCAGVIPDAFGINDSDGTVHANAETIRFCAKNDRVVALAHAEFFEAIFEVFPGFDAVLLRAALRFGLVGAKKDMAMEFADSQGLNFLLQFFVEVSHVGLRRAASVFFGLQSTILRVR